ncbi:MAG: Polysaccharide transporter, family [Blastococcus sp.]|jgi:lipopolysaccharide exporter|nr:Polysaccharide transporter, family [Blastococcus sp.]
MRAGSRAGGEATAPTSGAPERLTGATVNAVAWQGLSFVLGKLLVLVATVVLARVLGPEEFGLVSLALVFIGLVEVMADFGVAQALIVHKDSRRAADAALAFTVLAGFLLGAATFVGAPYLAQALGDPAIADFLRVLALSFVLASFGIVPDVLLRRDLLFKRRLAVGLSANATRGIVSIALALGGAGAWALVYGQLAAVTVMSIVAWTRVRYRPDLRWWRLRWGDLSPLLAFGAPTAANGLLNTIILNVDYIVVSHALGAAALGFYLVAFRVPEMVIVSVFQVLSQVVFPVFSRARGEPERMRRGYVRMLRLQTSYGVVLGCVLAALAPYLVPVVFGSGWEKSVFPLQALAVYAVFRSLGMGVVDVLKAMGRPNLALGLSVARLTLLLPALVLATAWGIGGIAVAQAVVALVFAVVMQLTAGRLLGIRPGQLFTACGPAIVAGTAAAAAAALVAAVAPGTDLVRLLFGLLAAGAVAVALLLGLSTQMRSDLRSLIPRRGRAGRRA